MKLKLAVLSLMLIFAVGQATAQANSESDVDTVILASTSNYPDALMSGPVSEKLGYPVLLTDRDELTNDTEAALQEMDPEEIIVVGGPSVISENVEDAASSYGETTRLWGTTQVGTSVEVSDYFWSEGSEEAVVIQYPLGDESYHSLLAQVKSEADENPVLISKEGTLSAGVLTQIQEMGAEEVEVYSSNGVNLTQDLQEAGVEDIEVNSKEREELKSDLKEKVNVSNRSQLVIVAAGNFQDTISASSSLNSASYIVSAESEIDGAVDKVRETDKNTTIKAVGRPELTQKIADRIEEETDREVDHVSGPPERVSSKMARENRPDWSRIQQKRSQAWKNAVEPEMEEKANRSIERAERNVDENSSEEAQDHLDSAKAAFAREDYIEARRESMAANSKARIHSFNQMDQEDILEKVREDQEDMREAAREIRETNQEMAQELQDAETPGDRMEIIRESREERMSIIQERKEEQQERMNDEMEAGNPGDSKLELELDGNELEVKAEYTGSSAGYTVDKNSSVSEGTVNADFTFNSPNEPAAQVITEYESDTEETLEDGNYTVDGTLTVDENVEGELTREIQVPGEVEEETETEQETENNRGNNNPGNAP